MMARGGDESKKGYVAQSVDEWAKLATTRPAFFILRTLILGSGIYFVARIVFALVERVF